MAADLFGYALALGGDTLVIGADGDDLGASRNQGSAHVFLRASTGWTEQQKLTASDGAASDYFGVALALSGDTIVAGASGDDINGSGRRESDHHQQ